MKKNILFITVIALVCFGCGREQRGRLTQRGKEIHDTWLMNTQEIIEKTIVPAFQMNAWIHGNDSTRRSIEDNYFPYMRIREEYTNEYSLYNGAQKVLTIYTANGLSLADEEAEWIISTYNTNPGYDNGQRPNFMCMLNQWDIHVIKSSDQQWNIQLDSTTCIGSRCDWQLTLPASDTAVYFSQREFTLTGSGKYIYSGGVHLCYNIDEPLQHIGEKYPWHRGVVSMTAKLIDPETNESTSDDIHVKAEYIGGGDIKITYRDISEIWEFVNR